MILTESGDRKLVGGGVWWLSDECAQNARKSRTIERSHEEEHKSSVYFS